MELNTFHSEPYKGFAIRFNEVSGLYWAYNDNTDASFVAYSYKEVCETIDEEYNL